MIRVLLVDDRVLTRTGTRAILERYPGLHVIGEAGDCGDAVKQTLDRGPHVVVIDALAHGLEAVDVTRRILSECVKRPSRVLVLINEPDEASAEALRAGAQALLLKGASPDEFASAVRLVARGYAVLAPPTGRYEGVSLRPAARRSSDELDKLTERERDVLQQLAKGASNAEIADELTLSESTVKSHVQHLLDKLGLRNRIQVVIYAFELGLIENDYGNHRLSD
ncbi:MAG TPA: response regulator transcription factor [Streptosporangiaceae bacterium]